MSPEEVHLPHGEGGEEVPGGLPARQISSPCPWPWWRGRGAWVAGGPPLAGEEGAGGRGEGEGRGAGGGQEAPEGRRWGASGAHGPG